MSAPRVKTRTPGVGTMSRRTKVEKHPGVYYREVGRKRRYEITFLDSTGTRRWRTVYANPSRTAYGNLEDAQAALEAARGRTRSGERTAPARLTLAEVVESWLPIVQAQVRRRTYVTYEGVIRLHVLPRLGRKRMAQIDADDVGRLIAEMTQAGYAPWTIRGVLTALSRLFGYAARRGLIAANPVARLERGERPKVERKDKRVLDRDEIGKLLGCATSPRYGVLLATAIFTGLRLSELLGLVWGDVDLEGGYVHVRKQNDRGKRVEPKTPRSVRDVVLMPQLAPLLREHKERAFARGLASPTDFVFASEVGTALSPRNVSRRCVESAVEAAGLNVEGKPRVTMHAFRRTFASHLILDLKLDVVQVSRQLGHANSSVTLTEYTDLFERARHGDEIRERMGESAYGNVLETAGGGRWRDRPEAQAAKVAQLPGSAKGGD